MGCANAKEGNCSKVKNRLKKHESDKNGVLERHVPENNNVLNRNVLSRNDLLRESRNVHDENLNAGDNEVDDSTFDPRVLQNSWGAVRGASNKSRNRTKTRRGGWTRNSTRNQNFGVVSDLEKLLPKLIEGPEGFQR